MVDLAAPPAGPAQDEPGFIRRNAVVLGVVAVAGTALIAWLAFGVFAVQTLWVDDEVDEAGPVFDSGATVEPVAAEEEPAGADEAAPSPTSAPAPVIETVASGSFISRDHATEGDVVVLTDGSPQRFLRFTDFATDNGPDLNVWLSSAEPGADSGAFDDDYVDLGDLSGNIGDQNYEIPPDVDLSRYRSVVIWCVRFSSPFGAAPLDAA